MRCPAEGRNIDKYGEFGSDLYISAASQLWTCRACQKFNFAMIYCILSYVFGDRLPILIRYRDTEWNNPYSQCEKLSNEHGHDLLSATYVLWLWLRYWLAWGFCPQHYLMQYALRLRGHWRSWLIGGMVSTTLLTLLVLPVIFAKVNKAAVG